MRASQRQRLRHQEVKDFLAKIENRYGKAQRIWVMDCGFPTEETLQQMRASDPPVSYLVGTPKGQGEAYVLAQSQDRIAKERAVRRRRLRAYLDRLGAIKARKRPLHRDAMDQALGAARKDAGRDARHVKVHVHLHGKGKAQRAAVNWSLDRHNLRQAWRREGRYLLRTNLTETDPVKLWEFRLQLTEVEQAFKELKGDLTIRPIHHQLNLTLPEQGLRKIQNLK
jgi:hypothetical protein